MSWYSGSQSIRGGHSFDTSMASRLASLLQSDQNSSEEMSDIHPTKYQIIFIIVFPVFARIFVAKIHALFSVQFALLITYKKNKYQVCVLP